MNKHTSPVLVIVHARSTTSEYRSAPTSCTLPATAHRGCASFARKSSAFCAESTSAATAATSTTSALSRKHATAGMWSERGSVVLV